VTAEDIESLDAVAFKNFIRSLLRVDAVAHGLRPEDVIVGEQILAADGGADAITKPWETKSNYDRDTFIPRGRAVWQLKARLVPPTVNEFRSELNKPAVRMCSFPNGRERHQGKRAVNAACGWLLVHMAMPQLQSGF
jgi:hypothetical protein